MPRDASREPSVFEIIEIPRSYLESATSESSRQPQVWNAKRVQDVFGRFLNTFLFSDATTAFRNEIGRLRILIWDVRKRRKKGAKAPFIKIKTTSVCLGDRGGIRVQEFHDP